MFGAKIKRAMITSSLLILFLLAGTYSGDIAAEEYEYEEIVIRFEVPKLIKSDILAQYNGKDIFLPMLEMFGLLDINVFPEFDKGRFSGQYLTSDNKFKIDLKSLKAECFGKSVMLDSADFVLTHTELFLRFDLFKEVFNLKLFFNFSELNVYIPLDKDFPAYQKLKRKAAHERLKAKEVALKDIYDIPYKREALKGGVADWVMTVNPFEKSGQFFGLALGGMFLGGDLTASGAVNTINGVNSEITRYKWHYFFRDNQYLTQADAGQIYTGGGLSRSLEGVQVTNRLHARRKYFQTINVTGNVGEGWEVELYVNNRLIDFSYTDENGDYNFLVDIHYGSSRILLKMYGPNGEIKTSEEFVRTPFNLLPKNKVEYTLSAGIRTEQLTKKKYAQANTYYGLFNILTLGISSDFPLAAEDGEKTTFAGEFTFQPIGSMLLGGIISPKKSMEFNLSYSKPSLININVKYAKYYDNSFWNRLSRLQNISFSLSSPLKIGHRYLGLRYRISIDRFPSYNVANMNYSIKLPIPYFHLTYLGNYKIADYQTRVDRKITSQLFISTMLLRWLKPQFKISYEHDLNMVSKYGIYLYRRIFKRGQLSISFERNELTQSNTIMMTFNIFSSFANFTSRLYASGDRVAFNQMQRGSIRFDQDAGRFRFERRNGQGLGTAVIWPFLDENYNGLLDHGEPLLPELRANIGGAHGSRRHQGELYYYDGLRPYDDYIVEIDEYSLDNPLLRPAHGNFRVTVDPNTVTSINVPIVTAGEVNGMVQRQVLTQQAGVGGIRVRITNEVTGKETIITTFNDGEYYYLGLVPGMYTAVIDPKQLDKYGYISEPSSISFQVKTVEGGDLIEKINFLLRPKK